MTNWANIFSLISFLISFLYLFSLENRKFFHYHFFFHCKYNTVCRFYHVCANTWLDSHDWAHTRSFPDTFVPRHTCAQTRLCPDTIWPEHDCAQTHSCSNTNYCGQTRSCPCSKFNNDIIIVSTRLIKSQLDLWKYKNAQLLLAKRSKMWLFNFSSAITNRIPTGIFLHFIIACQGTKYVSRDKRVCHCLEGTNIYVQKHVWAQVFLGTIVWAQVCLSTNVWSPKMYPFEI